MTLFITAFLSFSILVTSAFCNEISKFGARISRLNRRASLVRLRLKFWNPSFKRNKCLGYVKGKTNEYMLIKVPNYEMCIKKLYFTVGSYVSVASEDLKENLETGKELIDILVKKRLAIEAKKNRTQKNLDSYIERMEAMNKRYSVLREKLELEWKEKVDELESDRIVVLRNYKELEARLEEIDYNLEKYYIADKNLETDRWAIDPRFYFKK